MDNKSFALSALLVAIACSTAPQPGAVPTPDRTAQGRATDTTRAGADTSSRPGVSGPAQPRPYNRVITREAKTRRGMFAVHRVNDKLYFEIPRKELNKDMLLVGRFARAAASQPNTPGQFGTFVGDQFG